MTLSSSANGLVLDSMHQIKKWSKRFIKQFREILKYFVVNGRLYSIFCGGAVMKKSKKCEVPLTYIDDNNCVVLSWFNPTKVRGGRGLRIVWTWIMDLLGHEHGPLTPEFQGRQSQGNQGK